MSPDTDILLNSIKRAFFLFSRRLDGTLISVSPVVLSMLGYERQEFLQLFGDSLLHDRMQKHVRKSEYELQIDHKNGSTRWFKIIEIPIMGLDGTVRAFDCIAHDITDHRNNYVKLLDTEKNVRGALGKSIWALAASVETREYYSIGHQQRASSMARIIAQELGVSSERIDTIRLAAVIHDIGKITIPTEILNKKALLSDTELGFIQAHPEVGYNILKELDLPYPLADIVLQHHEKLDGSGYPHHLRGDRILPETRILTVADVIEAMASDRPQRTAMDLDSILGEITEQRGILLDPDVVDVSLLLLTEKRITL